MHSPHITCYLTLLGHSTFLTHYSHTLSAYSLLFNIGSKLDFPHNFMQVQHLHIVYLTIPSAADIIQHRIRGRIMNNQQEKMQKGLVMTQFEGLYWHLHERTEENYEASHSE
jgi:hypothetical protein